MNSLPNYALFCWVKKDTFDKILSSYGKNAIIGQYDFPIICIKSDKTMMDFINDIKEKCPLSDNDKIFVHKDGKPHSSNYMYLTNEGHKFVGKEFDGFTSVPK